MGFDSAVKTVQDGLMHLCLGAVSDTVTLENKKSTTVQEDYLSLGFLCCLCQSQSMQMVFQLYSQS